MNTLWIKAWNDLWLYKTRTLLAIISIAVGLFCVGALFGMVDLLLDKMDTAHIKASPSHISMILKQPVNTSLVNKINSIDGVDGVEGSLLLSSRIRNIGTSEWQTATVIIRQPPDTQQLDKFKLDSGSWPMANQIAIETMSARYLGINTGSQIEMDTESGIKKWQISGAVRHPFVKPPEFGGQPYFFLNQSESHLVNQTAHSFNQLFIRTHSPYQIDNVRKIADSIQRLLTNHQIQVNITLLQNPKFHWGRPILAGINTVLKAMAFTSLLLSSVLIFNTLSTQINQQTHQIGILKALGASFFSITRLYGYQVLLLTIIAIVLAIPAALIASHISACYLLGFFNIACTGFDYSVPALKLMIFGGILTSLLAALLPVIKAATMNVRKALSSYGIGSDYGNSRFDQLIETIAANHLPTLYASALGNLFRRKSSLLLTQSVLISCGVMFLVLLNLLSSVQLTLDNEMERSHYAARLGFKIDQPKQRVLDILHPQFSQQDVEFWQRHPILISKNNNPIKQAGSLGLQLIALPASTHMYTPLIEQGRWLQASDSGKRVIVLNADSAQLNNIQVGDHIDAKLGSSSEKWTVIGLYRWIAGSDYSVEPIYAPLKTVKLITQSNDSATFALIDTAVIDSEEETRFLSDLKQRFSDAGIVLDAYTTLGKLEQRKFANNQFNPVISSLFGLAAMIACVGGIGLCGSLMISVMQRTREIGVLTAIGASDKIIFRLFLLEGIMHGLMAWLITIPISINVAEPMAKQLGRTMFGIELGFSFNTMAVFYWLLIIIMIVCSASYVPARRASRLSIRECLID